MAVTRKKNTGGPELPYLFWLKGGKCALKENEKMISIFFNVLFTKLAFNGYVLVLKIIFNIITIKSCIELSVVELSLASADVTTIP